MKLWHMLLIWSAICIGLLATVGRSATKPVGLWLNASSLAADACDYKALGFSELVVLLPDKGQSLFTGSATQSGLLDAVHAVKVRANGLPVAVAVWCFNEQASWGTNPDTHALGIWTAAQWTTGFKTRLGWLADACAAEGVGLALDAECYALTGGGNGGKMSVNAAWKAPGLKQRAQEFRVIAKKAAWTCFYVWGGELARLEGLDDWFTGCKKLEFWDEEFTSGSSYSRTRSRAASLGGVGSAGCWFPALATYKASDIRATLEDRIGRAGAAWWYDPSGEVRKNQDLVRKALR